MSDRDHNDDLSLPKATVQKIVSEIIPPDLVFSRETRDALIECCIEFIMILTAESNDIAEKESKKTIACEHVLEALKTLGFYDYIEPIKLVITQHKESQKARERKVGKLEQSGRTEEELMEEQRRLFGLAKSKFQSSQQSAPSNTNSQAVDSKENIV